MKQLVSIIIPTYNRAHLIVETLDSILAQTYENWECIIVDDGSTDNTTEVVKKYVEKDNRFQYHKRPDSKKPGGNGARNYGFEVSKGEYINWFDSDDIMIDLFIESKINAFLKKINLVICSGYSADEKLENLKIKQIPDIKNIYKDYVMWRSEIMLPSVMFSRGFLMNIDLFNENLLRGQENEFFSRIFFKLNKSNYILIPGTLYIYRQHVKTKSFEDKNSYNSAFKKSLGLVSLDNIVRAISIGDMYIVNYQYNYIIHCLFETIYNKDKKLAFFFLKKMVQAFKGLDRLYTLQLMFYTPFFIFFGRTIYRIEKNFKNKYF